MLLLLQTFLLFFEIWTSIIPKCFKQLFIMALPHTHFLFNTYRKVAFASWNQAACSSSTYPFPTSQIEACDILSQEAAISFSLLMSCSVPLPIVLQQELNQKKTVTLGCLFIAIASGRKNANLKPKFSIPCTCFNAPDLYTYCIQCVWKIEVRVCIGMQNSWFVCVHQVLLHTWKLDVHIHAVALLNRAGGEFSIIRFSDGKCPFLKIEIFYWIYLFSKIEKIFNQGYRNDGSPAACLEGSC